MHFYNAEFSNCLAHPFLHATFKLGVQSRSKQGFIVILWNVHQRSERLIEYIPLFHTIAVRDLSPFYAKVEDVPREEKVRCLYLAAFKDMPYTTYKYLGGFAFPLTVLFFLQYIDAHPVSSPF